MLPQLLRTSSLVAAVLGLSLLVNVGAFAQSSQDMSYLTEQEHAAFTSRLQKSTSSAERAKITAEMNRIVQERKFEAKRKAREANPQQLNTDTQGGNGKN